MSISGNYRISMTLPAWTVENVLDLQECEGGVLTGTLDTLNSEGPGERMIPIKKGFWNKEWFQIFLSVGPGNLELVGRVDGDCLIGTVIMEDIPDDLSGKRIQA